MGDEMVKTMAHGLPDREGVQWAAQSAEKVSDKLPPDDLQAMKAAQAWAKSPTDANQAAAAAAASKANLQGPGALAARSDVEQEVADVAIFHHVVAAARLRHAALAR